NQNDWMFWLVRVLFTSSRPGGGFRVPAIGAIEPPPPKDPSAWPTFPILVIDDVPLSLYRGVTLFGLAEPFGMYVRDESKFWTINPHRLRPPDDPFLTYEKAIRSKQWPYKRFDASKKPDQIPYLEDQGNLLEEILKLVRTAYRPDRGENEKGWYMN